MRRSARAFWYSCAILGVLVVGATCMTPKPLGTAPAAPTGSEVGQSLPGASPAGQVIPQQSLTPPHTSAGMPPRLVVLLVIDQLRGDELSEHQALWQGGIGKLLQQGRWYQQAFHQHGLTETAAGHATLGTGVLPAQHGVINKRMWDGQQWRYVCDWQGQPCLPGALLVPTLADRWKAAYPMGKVVALSQKDRSAGLLAGQQPDLVAWLDEQTLAVRGRSAGETGLPAWLTQLAAEHVGQQPIEWLLPTLPAWYQNWPDQMPEEGSCGHGYVFPHRLAREAPGFNKAWLCTPASDNFVLAAAKKAMDVYQLGRDEHPDLLLVSLAAVDLIGHSYGHASLERVAALQALDAQLGPWLDAVQAQAGPQTLFAVSSDHGMTLPPAQSRAKGRSAQRIDMERLQQQLQQLLNNTFVGSQAQLLIEFPFVRWTGRLPPDKLVAPIIATSLRNMPAIYRAWTAEELAADSSELGTLMQASYLPERAGQVVFTLQRYFIPGSNREGSNHGSPWPDDRHVPVLLYGAGIEPATVSDPVGVIDMIATLAHAAAIPLWPGAGSLLP